MKMNLFGFFLTEILLFKFYINLIKNSLICINHHYKIVTNLRQLKALI
jgi:hypothetical protein